MSRQKQASTSLDKVSTLHWPIASRPKEVVYASCVMKEGIEDVNSAVDKVDAIEVTPIAYPVHKVESLIFLHSGAATCKPNFPDQIPFGTILVGLVIVPKCDCPSSPFRCSVWALSLRRRQVQARIPSMLVDPPPPLLPPLTRRLWPQKRRPHSQMPAGDLRRARIRIQSPSLISVMGLQQVLH